MTENKRAMALYASARNQLSRDPELDQRVREALGIDRHGVANANILSFKRKKDELKTHPHKLLRSQP